MVDDKTRRCLAGVNCSVHEVAPVVSGSLYYAAPSPYAGITCPSRAPSSLISVPYYSY